MKEQIKEERERINKAKTQDTCYKKSVGIEGVPVMEWEVDFYHQAKYKEIKVQI